MVVVAPRQMRSADAALNQIQRSLESCLVLQVIAETDHDRQSKAAWVSARVAPTVD